MPQPPALPPEIHHMTPVQMVLFGLLLLVVLWVAYRIGIVILRIVAGLLFLGLAGYGIWYLFFR